MNTAHTSSAAPTDAAANGRTSPPKKLKASRNTILLMAVIFLIGSTIILWSWHLWPFTSSVITTNDSYVRGQMTVLAPQVSGYVTDVMVRDYDHVKQGQPILKIDDRIYAQQVAQAQASLELARADDTNSRSNLARALNLAPQGALSARDRDTALATYRINKAKVAQAEANLSLAQINLSNTLITAPRDGQLGEASVRLGQYVTAGTQVVFLVPESLWVIANIKESQAHGIRLGQTASFTVDALDNTTFTGTVENIAPATGSEFSVLRPDNASGNFTKIVQRLPIRIAITPNQAQANLLRPGLSVVTSINTSTR